MVRSGVFQRLAQTTSNLYDRCSHFLNFAVVNHSAQDSPASWNLLSVLRQASLPIMRSQRLVFKPQTAESATTAPVVVIADEETETNSSFGQEAESEGVAQADVIELLFRVVYADTFPKVVIVLNSSLVTLLALRHPTRPSSSKGPVSRQVGIY
ncbi:hypothetical protein FRC03_003539 [Tulasnella sp. 419]|nr:hypothetical protein FRC03_003539 [Tulasnella sp. 419]